MGVDLQVHVGIVNYKGRQCYNIRHRKSFSEFAKVMKYLFFGERNGEHLFWWSCLSGLISYFPRWSESLLSCFWQAENRPKHYIVIKWSWTPQPRFRVWIFRLICKGFFLRKFHESSAKAVAKEKVSMEASGRSVAHTAPLQRQVKGTW